VVFSVTAVAEEDAFISFFENRNPTSIGQLPEVKFVGFIPLMMEHERSVVLVVAALGAATAFEFDEVEFAVNASELLCGVVLVLMVGVLIFALQTTEVALSPG
jgi:hypothetical protein